MPGHKEQKNVDEKVYNTLLGLKHLKKTYFWLKVYWPILNMASVLLGWRSAAIL
jgi:hypothetical protein